MIDYYSLLGLKRGEEVFRVEKKLEEFPEKHIAKSAAFILLNPDRKVVYDHDLATAYGIGRMRASLNLKESNLMTDFNGSHLFEEDTDGLPLMRYQMRQQVKIYRKIERKRQERLTAISMVLIIIAVVACCLYYNFDFIIEAVNIFRS